MSQNSFHDFEQAGWEKVAVDYDRGFGALTSQSIAPLLDAVGAAPQVRILDVASGPGYVASAAVRRGCSVIGVDFSSSMVALAARLNPGLEFQQGDAEALEFPDASFDAVVMNFGMLHLEKPEKAIGEAFRILRPCGRYAFTVWDTPEQTTGFRIVLDALQAHGDMNVPLPPGPPFFRFSDPEEARKTLEAAGFGQVQTRQVPQIWKLDSEAALLKIFREAAVRTAALLNAQTDDALERIQKEIEQKCAPFRQGQNIELSMPSILTCALKPSGPVVR